MIWCSGYTSAERNSTPNHGGEEQTGYTTDRSEITKEIKDHNGNDSGC